MRCENKTEKAELIALGCFRYEMTIEKYELCIQKTALKNEPVTLPKLTTSRTTHKEEALLRKNMGSRFRLNLHFYSLFIQILTNQRYDNATVQMVIFSLP